MAEFTEVMKQKKRMCEYICNDCPIDSRNNEYHLSCVLFILQYPQEAEELIMKWAEEHPIKTNADKFREVFGYELDFLSIGECANHCILKCGEHKGCKKCDKHNFWNKEYKERKEVE